MTEKLKNLFLEENFPLGPDNISDSLFMANIDGVLYGWDSEIERFKGRAIRGRDHYSLYSNFEQGRGEFENLIKEIAVIIPETKEVYYSGHDSWILKTIERDLIGENDFKLIKEV